MVRKKKRLTEEEKRERRAKRILRFFKDLAFSVVMFVLVMVFWYKVMIPNGGHAIIGSSMYPTYKTYAYAFGNKLSPEDEIHRGDIVIIKDVDPNFKGTVVKRIIGLPGETVEVKGGVAYVNGEKLDENYINLSGNVLSKMETDPIVLGEDEYFYLGDNRVNSVDAREYGPAKREQILERMDANKNIWNVLFHKQKGRKNV